MTGQDVALLLLTLLAILVAASLTAWTCWHAGILRGQRTVPSVHIRTPVGDLFTTEHVRVRLEDHRVDAARYALIAARTAMQVRDPHREAARIVTGV